MKAVKRTMMAVAVGMIMAAPAWAAGHVDDMSVPKTAELTFKAPATPVVLNVNKVDNLVAGPLTEGAKLADVDVTHADKPDDILAVAWTLAIPKQLVGDDGLTATILEKDNDANKLKVKLVMVNAGTAETVDGVAGKWIPSKEKGEYKGTIVADAGNTDVKAGSYTVSLDGAVYTA